MATLFTTQTPSNANATDGVPYELGMKFRSATAGQINAIRYWKASSDTGTHTGKIWSATGTLLASVTFTNETASGWQQQALATPLNIQANTTYVVSVNVGSHFPITLSGLANSVVNGDLSSVADGNNGVFGNPGTFPTSSYQNSNYFRDIDFTVVVAPTIAKVSGDNQSGTAGTTLPNPLVVQVNDSSGNPQSGTTVTFAVTAGGGSVSPTSAVTNAQGQASTTLTLGTASGATSPVTNTVSATASGIGSVTFTATANPVTENQTLFTTQTPSLSNATDGVSYELGMKFRSTKTGKINAVRYWKASSDTGTHTGKIWSATGTLLASVTFTNETASGWQEQALSTPLNISADTTYVVSVNINSHYVVTQSELANSVVNGDLSSVADGNNGVYGNLNTFPTNSFNNSNYFRDVKFVAGNTLVKVSGDNQTGAVGTTLPNPLVVQVNNNAGSPQSGVTVTFAVTSGSGSVSPTSAATNAQGQASTSLTLGSIPSGPNTAVNVTATVVGLGSVVFSAKATPVNPNPIYLENQNPGTTNWKIPTNNYASTEIAAYASATSVNKGGSLPIKVSLAQTGSYTIDIYRLGHYGGTGGRLIFNSGTLNGTTQPACTVDSTTRMINCNWSTSYTLQIGSNWTTGLYVAKLTAQNSGKQTQFWFVVRDDSSTADILFQSCFTTFQAYNSYGGYSTYVWNSIGGNRAFKCSFDRPFIQGLADGSWYFDSPLNFEHNMIRWLESQSYNIAYVTNIDVHTNSQRLRQHKVFLSVGHDEYWSLEQRNHVEQARDATPNPTNLAFFSANTAFWRIRLEPSASGGADRIMACYKESWQQDPVAPTNKFRSPQNNKPENALLGIMYTGDRSDSLYGGFNFIVANSSDAYYANTGVSNGTSLGQLVGFEWDAVVNNGATPSGLVILAQSPVNPLNIDPDLPPGTDTQIANAVRYTAASGAKVFSTGSIQWMWGLDSEGVSPPRTDLRVKQMAVNILADMNARPQTPDANIVVP